MSLDEARKNYPRVSEIINKQTIEERLTIPMEALLKAGERGTRVHEYCTSYLLGLWTPQVDEECVPYVKAFIKWGEDNIKSTLHTSTRLYDDERKFTGEFDLIAELDDKQIALIDIKTSSNTSKSWAIQLAAYKHLCELSGYKIDVVYNVHLKKTKAAVYETLSDQEKILVEPAIVKAILLPHHDLTQHWEIFNSALNCYDYFHRKEKDHVRI
jgi:CRISPR/Cas system-associated exonuclease Cas4 (RecB family)